MNTGLVYSCPIGPGDCEGVTGNRDLYIGSGIPDDTTNHVLQLNVNDDFFPLALSEGRLFDQARKSMIYEHSRDNTLTGHLTCMSECLLNARIITYTYVPIYSCLYVVIKLGVC